jgi:hypothetical protein
MDGMLRLEISLVLQGFSPPDRARAMAQRKDRQKEPGRPPGLNI